MEFIIDQLINFWQFTVFGVLVIVGFIINLFGVDQDEPLVGLKFGEMPHMKPITIPTAGKGFWGAIKMWLLGVRTWEISKDWNYSLNGENYVIPKGFVFDGASVPKFLASWLSPTGVLLVGGLVHDYAYKYQTLLKKNKKDTMGVINQKKADEIFRDVNIEINGFFLMNVLAYWSLRLGGFAAWNKHRKVGAKI